MVVLAFNPGRQEAEAGESLQVQSQSGLQSSMTRQENRQTASAAEQSSVCLSSQHLGERDPEILPKTSSPTERKPRHIPTELRCTGSEERKLVGSIKLGYRMRHPASKADQRSLAQLPSPAPA